MVRTSVSMFGAAMVGAVLLGSAAPSPAGTATAVEVTTAPSAGATVVLARWPMNSRPGATVMRDRSGNHLNGTIGPAVQAGVRYDGAKGYQWSSVSPTAPPAKPERLVLVDSNALNPRRRDYAVTIRYRTTRNFGNIIQKGQSSSTGGYFKFQQPNGILQCLFRGSEGSSGVSSKTALNDGAWHTVRCERDATGTALTVDGVVVRRNSNASGAIRNTRPLSIGGKSSCNQVKVTCDYFVGGIDYVLIETG